MSHKESLKLQIPWKCLIVRKKHYLLIIDIEFTLTCPKPFFSNFDFTLDLDIYV